MSDSEKTEVVEVPVEAIEAMAESINIISSAVQRVMTAGLSERALLVLLKDQCGSHVTINQIKRVLRALENLDTYASCD